MRFFVFFIFLCFGSQIAATQDCPDLINPLDGAVGVDVNTSIEWEAVPGVTGYIISLGTSPGGTEIINEQPTGSVPSYTPPMGLPDDTLIYVTITLFYFNLPDIPCPSKSFRTVDVTESPECTTLSSPMNGTSNVNIATTINWEYSVGATGYLLSIGTTPGGNEIENNLDVGNTLSFNPNPDLPAETPIYVTVIPYNENGQASGCEEFSFTTGAIAALPACVSYIIPEDGSVNVPLSPLIEWEAVPGATGYIVFIGRSPTENDILDGGVFSTNSTFVINFEPNNVYFIRVIPFNEAGEAIGCGQTSFSTILGCGPFLNPDSGELESLNPEISFPDQVGICLNDVPTQINATDVANGYRWYRYNVNDELILIGEGSSIGISEEGEYRYEAYNVSSDSDFEIECGSVKDFSVVSSERPSIDGVIINPDNFGITIEIYASGSGDYEYAIAENGPFQSSNIFTGASEDTEYVYVRDINGCGEDSLLISGLIVARGFPKFFTPNGDGFNDTWQYRPKEDDEFVLKTIHIFDRFGKLIKSMDPNSEGWNGTFSGELLPQSDYWYKAISLDGLVFTGHFSLRR